MNQSHDVRRREIATRDLIYRSLRAWRWILLSGLLAAALAAAFALRPAKVDPGSASGTSYEDELSAYEAEKAAYETLIARTKEQLAEKRRYLASSLLLAIDPAHVGRASAVCVVLPGGAKGGASAEQITDTCAAFLSFGLDLKALAEELGTEEIFLKELLSCTPSLASTSAYAAYPDAAGRRADAPRGTLTVTAVHPDAETAERLLDTALAQLTERCAAWQDSLGAFALRETERSTGYYADSAIGSRSENLLQELYMLSTNEERLESQLATLKRPSPTSGANRKLSAKTLILYALIGFVGGALLACLAIAVILSFSGRVLSSSELTGVFGLRKLAVIPDEHPRRGPLDTLIARLDTDKKNRTDRSVRFAVAAEALGGKDLARSRYVLIGSVPPEALRGCAEGLNAAFVEAGLGPELQTAPYLTEDPRSVKKLSTADGVILVERLGVSRYSSVAEILSLAEVKAVPLIGVIFL